MLLDGRPWHTQQRPQMCSPPARLALQLGHGRQPVRAGAAQQLQQQRLGLIVLLVGRQDEIRVQRGKNLQTRPARRRFDAGRIGVCNLHAMNAQFDAMCFTQPSTKFCPVIRLGRQAVVDVNRLHFEGMFFAQRTQGVQQDDRVDSSRQGEHQAGMWGNVTRQTVRHDTDDRLT